MRLPLSYRQTYDSFDEVQEKFSELGADDFIKITYPPESPNSDISKDKKPRHNLDGLQTEIMKLPHSNFTLKYRPSSNNISVTAKAFIIPTVQFRAELDDLNEDYVERVLSGNM